MESEPNTSGEGTDGDVVMNEEGVYPSSLITSELDSSDKSLKG